MELGDSEDGPVAVVRIARGSHAPLPRAGSFAAPVAPDHNDGQGPRVRPRLEEINDDGPSWVLWPGRWGATRRREYFEGDSPRGPQEHPCWWDPGELHREGRPWSGDEPVASGIAEDPVGAVELEARREEGLAVVAYRFAVPPVRRLSRRESSPRRSRPADEVGVARSFPVEGRQGSFAIELPGDREWRGVRACATSALGAPGSCRTASLAEGK